MTFFSIKEADRYLSLFCKEHTLTEAICFKLRLVTEELASNMFKYTDTKHFTLTLAANTRLEVTLTYPSKKFDLPHPTIEKRPLSQMEEGGLGLFLAQEMTHTLSYRHDNGKNIYTFSL